MAISDISRKSFASAQGRSSTTQDTILEKFTIRPQGLTQIRGTFDRERLAKPPLASQPSRDSGDPGGIIRPSET